MKNKYIAEAFGTMVLVLLGCGAAVFNGGATSVDAVLTIAFAFGMSVIAMAYAIGPISGCHINPAITLGVWLSGRMKGREACGYMLAQAIGALVGSAIIWAVVNSGSVALGATATGANSYRRQSCAGIDRRNRLYLYFRFRRTSDYGYRERRRTVRRISYRSDTRADPYRLHSADRNICQSGPFARSRPVRRRHRTRTTLGIHRGSFVGRRIGCIGGQTIIHCFRKYKNGGHSSPPFLVIRQRSADSNHDVGCS